MDEKMVNCGLVLVQLCQFVELLQEKHNSISRKWMSTDTFARPSICPFVLQRISLSLSLSLHFPPPTSSAVDKSVIRPYVRSFASLSDCRLIDMPVRPPFRSCPARPSVRPLSVTPSVHLGVRPCIGLSSVRSESPASYSVIPASCRQSARQEVAMQSFKCLHHRTRGFEIFPAIADWTSACLAMILNVIGHLPALP